MATLRSSSNKLGLLLFLPLWLMACVRLVDPGEYVCKADSDCESGEKCYLRLDLDSARCVDARYCSELSDCGSDQMCDDHTCVAAQCTFTADPRCGDYFCGDERRCLMSCSTNTTCRNDKKCGPDGKCHTPPPPVPPPGIGDSCTAASACTSGKCCVNAPTPTCQATCPCESRTECGAGEECCPLSDSLLYACQTGSCHLGAVGENCAGSDYCVSKRCVDKRCAPQPKAPGASCANDDECQTRACCVNPSTGTKSCVNASATAAKCAPHLGDYCIGNACPSGSYCDGYSNFSDDGFCSSGCPATGCGFNSSGRANVCIVLTSGSSPPSACKPGCSTNSDCTAIHPDLRCFLTSATAGACDFGTSTWAQPPDY